MRIKIIFKRLTTMPSISALQMVVAIIIITSNGNCSDIGSSNISTSNGNCSDIESILNEMK